MANRADLILTGGTVLTMDGRMPRATSVAIAGGRVLAVGNEELLGLRRDATEIIPLNGRTVCPGFIDAHHHLTLAAWCQTGVDLEGCHSKEEVLGSIRAAASRAQPGDWLYCFNYTPFGFRRGSGLTRYDLDQVAGDRPVVAIHYSFHEAVASSAALAIAGINEWTPDPEGGRIVRDRMHAPTGELLERAAGRVELLARSSAAGTGYEDWSRAMQAYCKKLLAAGITHVCDPGVDGMLEGYLRRAQDSGELPLSVSMLFVSRSGLFEPPADRLSGPVTGERMDKLDVGALKLFADGGSRCAVCVGLLESLGGVLALAGRAARLRRPALLLRSRAPDRPILTQGGRLRMGFLHYAREELQTLCQQADARGFQLAVHAACNAGIENVIRAYEQLGTRRYRHRVEHLVSLDRSQAARLAATGAIGVVQPSYLTILGDDWEAMPAPTRLHSLPLRDLLEAGVSLAGSSDAPVAAYSPILGMEAAVTRRTASGLIHQGEQSISPLQALELWTTGAALAANLSAEAGRLRPGSRGNLVVLSKNPLEVPPDEWVDIRVDRTIIGGTTVYLNAEANPNAHE